MLVKLAEESGRKRQIYRNTGLHALFIKADALNFAEPTISSHQVKTRFLISRQLRQEEHETQAFLSYKMEAAGAAI